MASHIDPQLAEKILHEVKSQGVFDEFRKDSISDVDTKPAYQNLRQRVENAVQKFLSEQRWTPDTNKYHLRERLRRHIVESGFLDVGVERIVDQVVNPKIGSVFQPRIEEIAYKFLGISPPLPTRREPPLPPPMPPLPPIPPLNGSPLKIETGSSLNLLPTDLEQVSPDSDKMKEEDMNDMTDMATVEEKADDDDESPPFEPLTECKSPKSEVNVKKEEFLEKDEANIEPKREIIDKIESMKVESIKNEESSAAKERGASNDAIASQESQLSQVSSDSRLSSVSNQLLQSGNDATSVMDNTDVNISEEAQMPKFNENSTGTEGSAKGTAELHFDIKKDVIKFEGTERKTNILHGDGTEFSKDAPIIKDTFIADSLEMKGSFHFTKLNVEVEPCNTTHGAASSISSQDDTSSAQLCIVERPDNELQGETNSIQKCPQEDSSTNITITNSQIKRNDGKTERNGKNYSSSSSSSKKSSSKDKKHSSEKERQHDEKDRNRSKYHERSRDRERDRDRYGDAKYSSKTSSSSSRRHESYEKHKSSSKRSGEKDQHISSSSRSESRSHHKSSKRDHRDKYDRKKSHKSSSSSKEHRSGVRKSRTDDHNESREKIRWRKSTDSNDEDKNPNGHTTSNCAARQTKSSNDTESAAYINSKSTSNGSNKHYKETKKSVSHDSKSISGKTVHENGINKVNSARVVILNDVLEHPSTNFIELETKSSVQIHTIRKRSSTLSSEAADMDLLYFEEVSSPFQTRLDLLNEAIGRCQTVINGITSEKDCIGNQDVSEDSNDGFSSSKESACQGDTEMDNVIRHAETKATLLVDCFHYNDCSDQNAVENLDATSPKRLKLSTECNIAKLSAMSAVSVCRKENQMKENNSIITDEDNIKPTLSKRIETMTKLSQQQRYSSEDLYKPRPVLGQRSKRRGLDTVI